MKRFILLFYLATLAIITLFGCDNTTYSGLSGKWQLKTVEHDGRVVAVDTVWYNFQSESIFALQVYVPQRDTFLMLIGLRRQNNEIISVDLLSYAYLNYSDWPDTCRSFAIETLNSQRLILRSEDNGAHYSFTKY